MPETAPSNVKVIREYFALGTSALKEIKELSDSDKQQLGDAIRSGTLDY